MIIQLNKKEAQNKKVENCGNSFLRFSVENLYFKLMTNQEVEEERNKRIQEYNQKTEKNERELYKRLKEKYG